MRMKRKRLKAAMLSIAVAAGMLLPCAASAQGLFGSGSGSSGSDGFFKNDNGHYRDISQSGDIINEGYGGDYNNPITNETYGVPLGSGIVLLTVLGTGYAVMKRRKK